MVLPLDQPVTLRADGTPQLFPARVGVKGVVTNARIRVLQHRHEADAVNRLRATRRGQAGQLGQRWVKVDRLGELPGRTARLGQARRDDDDRDAIGLLEVGVLGPDAQVAQVPAVVAPQNDDRVVGQAEFAKRLGHFANLRIHIAGARIVAVDELAGEFFINLAIGRDRLECRDLAAALEGDFRRIFRERLVDRHRQLGRVVHVPIFLWR